MRVLIISGEDLAGGGHRAAFRLHQALRGIGVESFMAVRRKHSSDPHVHRMTPSELGWPPIGRGCMDLLPKPLLTRRDDPISLGLQTARLDKLVQRFSPDVVNLHWINGGIASIRSASRLTVPVIWTLHDMWAFTGGCHYAGDCQQYRQSCTFCPKVRDFMGAPRVTAWVHRRKQRHWGSRKQHAITPSAWMRDLALSSSLFANGDITHVRNCVDPTIFNGGSREQTRVELGLAATSKAVLFSSANQPRKGAYIIPDVVRSLRSASPQHSWRFLFMGGLPPSLELAQDIITLPRTTDEARVASYYTASDVYALPSLEDNLPNTISESLSCGTPVAAFPTGGIVEMVQSGVNGYLTKQVSGDALVEAVRVVLTSSLESRERISSMAHAVYSPSRIARDHLKLFTKAFGAA